MTLSEAKDVLSATLLPLYEKREATQIADMVMEHLTGLTRTDRLLHKNKHLSDEQMALFHDHRDALSAGKPVQYVLGEAWFAGLRFIVNEHTLIPRPETEELIEWIKEVASSSPLSILDIGTGSGCIPITLKKLFPNWHIQAIDLSEEALAVARENARLQGTEIDFIQMDFLNEENWKKLLTFDIIVSNPPYIKISESMSMAKHVLDYEPHLALFVPDEDALIFYKKIAAFGQSHLNNPGLVFLEINQLLGDAVVNSFSAEHYSAEVKKDIHRNDRMIKAEYLFTNLLP
jgi:release factor glutamine methyltransferase